MTLNEALVESRPLHKRPTPPPHIPLRREAMLRLEDAVAMAGARMEEFKSEHGIATKLVKQMNKELKSSLAAETRKVARLEREIASAASSRSGPAARPGTLSPAGMASRPGGPPPSPLLTASTASPVPGRNGGGDVRVAGNGSGAGAASSASAPRPRATPSAPMGGGDMAETVKLLGERLRVVLAESEVAREKTRMLEGIVQSLSIELDDKKRLIRGLTSSGSGASGSGASAKASPATTDAAELRALLDAASIENERLKGDLRTLGLETDAAQSKARVAEMDAAVKDAAVRELEAALTALREAGDAGGGDGGDTYIPEGEVETVEGVEED